jgi:hypothetical protein
VINVHEQRAGDMCLPVRALTRADIGKVVPAIYDDERLIVEMPREIARGDERAEDETYSSSRRRNSWKCCMPSSIGD